MERKQLKRTISESAAVILSIIIFWIPFYFIIITALKNSSEASQMRITFPSSIHIIENLRNILTYSDGIVFRAFWNSTVLTALSIVFLVIISSMAGYVLQRRKGKYTGVMNFFILAGLIVPPAIVPTYWILNALHLARSITGVSLLEATLLFSFAAMLYKAFFSTISREIDEAAIVDGCGSLRMFFQIIFPLLKPVTSTIIVISAINVYNDFVNPLYFLPGPKNATVQLTIYYFFSRYQSQWNLVFTDVLMISVPALVLYLFFNKQIIAGMTAGSIKG